MGGLKSKIGENVEQERNAEQVEKKQILSMPRTEGTI